MPNHNVYLQSSSTDAYAQWDQAQLGGAFAFGNEAANITNVNGAARFPNVTINQGVTVDDAILRVYAQFQGTGLAKVKTFGIKETNTASFSSNPFGRPTTTAFTTSDISMPGTGNFSEINVTSQVNEILGQGGWSNGNAMGFIVNNNGSGTIAYVEDDSIKEQLLIRISAQGNFTPTPGTNTAGSQPATVNFGIRVSQPGQDVKTATEAQLYFSTRKKELRINQEFIGTAQNFTHGLSYAPFVFGYDNNGGTINIMNYSSNIFSVQSYLGCDGMNVYLYPVGTAICYVCIDPLT